jgi:hypothetical protein
MVRRELLQGPTHILWQEPCGLCSDSRKYRAAGAFHILVLHFTGKYGILQHELNNRPV